MYNTCIIIEAACCLLSGYNKDHYSKLFYSTFGPGSLYDSAGPQQYIEGTVNATYPIIGPWRNRTMLRYCQSFENNATIMDDDWPDPDIVARIVPIVTMWAGQYNRTCFVKWRTNMFHLLVYNITRIK